MQPLDSSFQRRVCDLVAQIPAGRVMTYGQIAAMCGSARAARIVGGIAHYGDPNLPWHRVVNKSGGLASGYPGGRKAHKQHLEREGVNISNDYLINNVAEILWNPNSSPAIAIVGPTASGKSAMAMKLAMKIGGEIICADSRTIYKDMNVGTAKPSLEDRKLVKHHCLDMVNPNEFFSVAQFKQAADKAILDITSRGKIPLLVGGSGLYIDAVLYDFKFASKKRSDLDNLSLKQLQNIADQEGLNPSSQVYLNKRHLTGFISRGGISGNRRSSTDAVIIGIEIDRELLNKRIERRVERMFSLGILDETNSLLEKWGENAPGLNTPGYIPVKDYILRNITLEEAKVRFIRNDKLLAKRQMTWFKRNKDIHWVKALEEAEQIIKEKLSVLVQ